MIMNVEKVRILKKEIMAYVKLLSWHSSGDNEEKIASTSQDSVLQIQACSITTTPIYLVQACEIIYIYISQISVYLNIQPCFSHVVHHIKNEK
jgi:hypothetical protein